MFVGLMVDTCRCGHDNNSTDTKCCMNVTVIGGTLEEKEYGCLRWEFHWVRQCAIVVPNRIKAVISTSRQSHKHAPPSIICMVCQCTYQPPPPETCQQPDRRPSITL